MTLGSKKEGSLLTAAFGKPAAERGGEKEGGSEKGGGLKERGRSVCVALCVCV